MSYILDALRKADAERARGRVPGLHAHPVAPAPAPRAASPGAGAWLALAAAAAVAVAVAGVAALLWNPQAPLAVVAPSPAPVAPPSPTHAASAAPMASVPESPPAPAPSAPAAQPELRTPPNPAITAAAARTRVAPRPPAATPVAVSPLLGELPPDIRSQIPALAISGSVYSDNPAQRLLLVNGQVLPQGSAVAPEVTLVEIRVGNSEFSFRGTRFRLAH